MINYNNGKIYKIVPLNGDEGDIYIGSTTKEFLSQRLATHKSGYNTWLKFGKQYLMSYNLFDKYGFENCKIYLIENCPVKTKNELLAREGFFIQNIKCVNKKVYRTDDERKEHLLKYSKDYYLKHGKDYYSSEEVKQHKKEYYEKKNTQKNLKIIKNNIMKK